MAPMTTLPDRPNTALLIIDMQIGVVAKAIARDAVIANIAALVERARRARVPVVWVQDMEVDGGRGSAGWPIVPELTPGAAEPLVEKAYGDAFEATRLESVLAELGVSTPLLDSLCDSARRAGAFGAKLTGAGGGGAVIAIAPRERESAILTAWRNQGISGFLAHIGDQGGPS